MLRRYVPAVGCRGGAKIIEHLYFNIQYMLVRANQVMNCTNFFIITMI